jgi:protein-S-isoprenylcysteine O-methyltransferase Ste14
MDSTQHESTSSALMNTKIHPPILAGALLLITLILHFMLPEERIVGWHHLIGLILTVAGMGLSSFAAALFQARETTRKPYGEPSAFVVQPPYTWTRNPMYLGLTIALLGLAIFFDSTVMLLAPAAFFVVIDKMLIPREEETMERLFSQQYVDYKNRVRRWL